MRPGEAVVFFDRRVVGALTILGKGALGLRKGEVQTTPVGFEPTRGDPIGLAGRRLNRSAKVSCAHAPTTLAKRKRQQVDAGACVGMRACEVALGLPRLVL